MFVLQLVSPVCVLLFWHVMFPVYTLIFDFSFFFLFCLGTMIFSLIINRRFPVPIMNDLSSCFPWKLYDSYKTKKIDPRHSLKSNTLNTVDVKGCPKKIKIFFQFFNQFPLVVLLLFNFHIEGLVVLNFFSLSPYFFKLDYPFLLLFSFFSL